MAENERPPPTQGDGGAAQAPTPHPAKRAPAGLPWRPLLVAALSAVLLATLADLRPLVDKYFFFSASDAKLTEDARIGEIFPTEDQQLILGVLGPDIGHPAYLDSLAALTRELAAIPGVKRISSLSAGPKNLDDARASPLWRRLLLPKGSGGSNVVIFVAKDFPPGPLVTQVEKIAERRSRPGFQIAISGVPWITEHIARAISRDFYHFSLTAMAIFGAAVALIFRSWRILVGTFAAAHTAIVATMLTQQLLGIKIGLLTANLSTIVFVLTLSPIVFMTSRWSRLSKEGHADPAGEARRQTWPAAFFCALTTLLGFLSLLLVEAKPLRELGIGGSVGTLWAVVLAFWAFPPFLRWTPRPTGLALATEERPLASPRLWLPSVALAALILGLAPGLSRLNTDPSLLAYFKPEGPLHPGIAYLDRHGGSSPLFIVIRDGQGGLLNTRQAFERLSKLHDELEKHPAVGSALSLPILLQEARRNPIALILTFEKLISTLESPDYGEIAKGFITKDRKLTLFMPRMVEDAHEGSRLRGLEEIRGLIRQHGFEVELMGGTYDLMGQLGGMVKTSLGQGLGGLLVLFGIVALIVGRSPRVALAMVACLAVVPGAILGSAGVFGIPLDVISVPASNVCLGMAVDAMIHLAAAVRRSPHRHHWAAWMAARHEQAPAIVASTAIVAAGFAIFGMSSFPPTQRFGGAVVLGSLVSAVAALYALPLLAARATSPSAGSLGPTPARPALPSE